MRDKAAERLKNVIAELKEKDPELLYKVLVGHLEGKSRAEIMRSLGLNPYDA